MKIAYFIESLYNTGGMERVLCLKANYLADVLRYDVTIFTFLQFNREIAFNFSERIKLVHFDIDKNNNSVTFIKQFLERRQIVKKLLNKALQGNRFDIAVSMEFGPEFFFLPFIKDGSHKIAEYHFTFDLKKSTLTNNSLKNKFRYILFYFPWYRAARAYERFIILTEQDNCKWKKILKNTAVIGNPVSIANGISTLDSKECITVGRLSSEKGFARLIEMWKEITLQHPGWKLKICGDGPERNSLQQLINESNLGSCITLTGNVANISHVYRDSSIFLMTSEYEGFGLVLAEAMSHGLPCVAFDCGCGPSDIIDDGVNGFLVPPTEQSEYISKVVELMNDLGLRKSFGKAAITKAKTYELPTIMTKWDTLFHKLRGK